MKIAIFGASGGIGKFAVQHALAQGFEVNAYVRNPDKVNVSHQNLVIIKGQLDESENIKKGNHCNR